MSYESERYEKLRYQNLDSIIAKIQTGDIECGRKLNKIKLSKNEKFNGKVIFAKQDGY